MSSELHALRRLLRFPEWSLSKDESILAEEAKRIALSILTDVLKKGHHLLVESPEDVNDRHRLLISPTLVQKLINELLKVSFMKDTSSDVERIIVAYVHRDLGEPRVIYLCPLFWKHTECFGLDSRPLILIHEVAHFLGYEDFHFQSTTNGIGSTAHKRKPGLTTYEMEAVFAFMAHGGKYTDGAYSCCGETSRDTVCEKSDMAFLKSVIVTKTYSKERLKLFQIRWIAQIFLMLCQSVNKTNSR